MFTVYVIFVAINVLIRHIRSLGGHEPSLLEGTGTGVDTPSGGCATGAGGSREGAPWVSGGCATGAGGSREGAQWVSGGCATGAGGSREGAQWVSGGCATGAGGSREGAPWLSGGCAVGVGRVRCGCRGAGLLTGRGRCRGGRSLLSLSAGRSSRRSWVVGRAGHSAGDETGAIRLPGAGGGNRTDAARAVRRRSPEMSVTPHRDGVHTNQTGNQLNRFYNLPELHTAQSHILPGQGNGTLVCVFFKAELQLICFVTKVDSDYLV